MGATSFGTRDQTASRLTEPVGKDPAGPRAKQVAKQAELDGKKAGVKVSVEAPDQSKAQLRLADSIAEYNNFIKDNKRRKTWMAYKNTLAYFAKFWDEHGIQVLSVLRGKKELSLKYPKFVMANGNGESTAFINFANLMIFLRWAGIETGIKKSEWPERPERDPEEYSDEELTAMLKAADAEERLVLKSFLFSGFRSGEIAHMTYERVDFDSSVWRVRKNDDWGWKPKKKASNRDVPEHPDLTTRITGSREFAAPSIVAELRRFHVWRQPAEGLLLVRNFGEPRLPSNKVVPSRVPRRSCPKQPRTKDALPPSFYPAPNSATGDTANGPLLPLWAELQDLGYAN